MVEGFIRSQDSRESIEKLQADVREALRGEISLDVEEARYLAGMLIEIGLHELADSAIEATRSLASTGLARAMISNLHGRVAVAGGDLFARCVPFRGRVY